MCKIVYLMKLDAKLVHRMAQSLLRHILDLIVYIRGISDVSRTVRDIFSYLDS